ncbi:MAG: hypothetical protein HY866_04755 [Chloroflexi bacterium]|nr:hypothetical protein [Chloroflexota bacterium]
MIVALMLAAPISIYAAQGGGVNLIQTAEYDIGLDCPVTSALDPAGTTLWILMDNCFGYHNSLRAYNVADGTQVDVDDYADALVSLDEPYVDLFITPMGFTPAGDLSIRYNDPETYQSFNVLIPLASGGEVITQTSATYDALLAEYSDYPEFSVYSPDHSQVVVAGGTSFHVVDVQAETEIVEIPVEGGTDYALASFSANGEHLDVIHFNNPDDMSDFSSTLLIYSLPDGPLLQQYPVPSSAVWVSPDEAYAAVQLFSSNVTDLSELVVINLETGLASPASNLLEEPAPVTTCLNSGNDVSDIGYMTSGYLSLTSLYWLPDSSGITLSLSYNGEGAEGAGSSCIFNYSRLRTYTVETAG